MNTVLRNFREKRQRTPVVAWRLTAGSERITYIARLVRRLLDLRRRLIENEAA
jgi:hypothetical protein